MPDDFHPNAPSEPIRPLRPWLSRLFVTVAIVSALTLAILAAWSMGRLGADGSAQSRYDTINRMRAAEDSSAHAVRPDSTGSPNP